MTTFRLSPLVAGLVMPKRHAVTAAGSEKSAVIVLVPESPDKLAVEGGDKASELHVTVLYLGPAKDISPEAMDIMRDALKRWAQTFEVVNAHVRVVQKLGDDDALVCTLRDGRLSNLRDAMRQTLQHVLHEAFVIPPNTFQDYIPHLTLGYKMPDDVEIDVRRRMEFETIRLTKVGLWVGTKHEEWPLGVDPEAVDMEVERIRKQIRGLTITAAGTTDTARRRALRNEIHDLRMRVYSLVASER